jgi:hypothetical protein
MSRSVNGVFCTKNVIRLHLRTVKSTPAFIWLVAVAFLEFDTRSDITDIATCQSRSAVRWVLPRRCVDAQINGPVFFSDCY